MSNDTRWIALLAVMGLCTAYVLWGHPRAPDGDAPISTVPSVAVAPTPSTLPQTTPAQTGAKLQDEKILHGSTALTFTPDSIDFGIIPVNESRTAMVQLDNPTDATITIRDLIGSCGCLQLEASGTELAPHGSLKIKVNFAALPGRKTDVVRGCFRTSEKGEPFCTFDVRAKVKEEFSIQPGAANFEVLKKGVARTKDITLRSDDGLPFNILLITGARTEYTYAWEPVEGKNRSEYTIHATLKGEKGGMVSDNATITTDRAKGGSVPLHVSGTIEPDVSAVPSIINADMDADNQVSAFTTVMKRLTPGRLEILSVTDGAYHPVPLDFVVDRLEENSVRLSIKFKVPYPKRAPYGHMVIKTNVEENDFNLPYRVNANIMAQPPMKK